MIVSLPAQGAQYDATPADVQAYDVRHRQARSGCSTASRIRASSATTRGRRRPTRNRRRRPQLERVHGRRAARHRVHQLRQPALRFLRRRSTRATTCSATRSSRSTRDRQADLALPARASRSVGLRPAAGAEAADASARTAATSTSWRRRRSTGSCSCSSAKTGRPIWPIEERPVPQSDVPGELTSPTQPFPTKPAPFARQSFTEKDINPYLPAAEREALVERFKTLRNDGLFTPPSFEGSIRCRATTAARTSARPPSIRRAARCTSSRRALPTVIRIALPRRRPDGAAARSAADASRPDHHGGAEGPDDRGGPGAGRPRRGPVRFPSPYEFMNTNSLSMSAIGPPWSEMTAYDLNTGEIKWRIPPGRCDAPPELGIPANTGSHFPRERTARDRRRSGVLVDRLRPRFRAYDRDTGKEVWSRDLPAASEGMPATYEVNGRQFIVVPVAAGSGQFAGAFGGPPPAPRSRRRRRRPHRSCRVPRARVVRPPVAAAGPRRCALRCPASTWCSRCRRITTAGPQTRTRPTQSLVRR